MPARTNCRTRSTRGSARSRRLLEAFDERPAIYDPAAMANAGVFVSIDADGDLRVERGYVRPEDEAACVTEPDAAGRRRRRSPLSRARRCPAR